MSQIIYKGKPYGKQEINLTASLEDPTQLDLTQEQIEGTEPIDLTVDYTNDGSTTNIKMRLPTSLVIANGVIVNENLKQNVWSASEEVTDIVMDQGYRYEYGTGGNRLIWQGVRVLMGKIGTEPTEDSPNQYNLANKEINNTSSDYPAQNSEDLSQMYWNSDINSNYAVITKILPDGLSETELKQYIQNFITEEDLYSYIPFYQQSGSISSGSSTYLKIVSKTDSDIILSVKGYNGQVLQYFKIPSNATHFGFFFHSHEFSADGAKVSIGVAAFDNTQTEIIYGLTRSKLVAFLPFYRPYNGNWRHASGYWRTYYKFTPVSVLDCYYDNGNVYSDPEKTEVITFSKNENRMYHDLTTGYYYAIGDYDRLQKMNIVTKISELEYIGLIDNNPQITNTALSGENSPEFKYAAGITAKYEHITKADYDYLTRITFAELPIPSRSILGNSYVITDAFTTTSNFEGGAGISYPAETSVIVVNTGTDANPVYKYRVITNG